MYPSKLNIVVIPAIWMLAMVPITAAHADDEPLSMDQLLELALSHHPERKAMDARLEASRSERASAGRWGNPELSGDVGYQSSRDTDEQGITYSVQLLQSLDYAGKSSLRKAIADQQIEWTHLLMEQWKRDVSVEVIGLARIVSINAEFEQSLRELFDAAETSLSGYLLRNPAGPVQHIERSMIEGGLLKLKTAWLEAAWESENARANLNLLLNRPMDAPLHIVPEEIPLSHSNAWKQSMPCFPMLGMRAIEWRQAALEVDAAVASGRPELAIGPYYNGEHAGEREYSAGLAFSMSLPLWNRNKGEIARAVSRQYEAEAVVQSTERAMSLAWHTAVNRLRHDQAVLENYPADYLSKLKEAAANAASLFRNGTISATSFLEMQQRYATALRAHNETWMSINQTHAWLSMFGEVEDCDEK